MVGILFPPSLMVMVAAGVATGAFIGHFWEGMSRRDLKELGEALDVSRLAIIVVAGSEVEKVVQEAITQAGKQVEKEIRKDRKALKKSIDELTVQ